MTRILGLTAAAALIGAVPVTALAQQQQGPPYMMYGYDGFGWGHALVGLSMMVLFWGGLIALVFVAVRWLSSERAPGLGGRSSALGILEERFARGEIEREEFLERKRHLSG